VRYHHILASLGILLAGGLVAVTSGPGVAGAGRPIAPGAAAQALPAGATPVTVSEGLSATGIDADLTPAASISGSLISSTGKQLTGEVDAYLDGKLAATGYAFDGHYEIDGLFAASYAVCAGGGSLPRGGGSGFLGRCWQTAAFYGTVPSGATLVTLADSEQRAGIDLVLPPAAAIAGTVTTPGGVGLSQVSVFFHNRSTGTNYRSLTTGDGVYQMVGLRPSAKGYRVCFRPVMSPTGTGYLPQCYKNKSWNGSKYPASVTPVSVTLGATHRRVDQTLPPGGAVAGKVTDSATGDGVHGAVVSTYSAKGKLLGSTSTRATGRYRITSLQRASGDRVCVHPVSRVVRPSYHGVCWKHAAWSGGRLPSGAAPVTVPTGSTHTGVDLHLRKTVYHPPATVAGTVTQQSDAAPIQNAFVYLFHNGTRVSDRPTDASGHYQFKYVKAGSGYAVCVQPLRGSSASPPDAGWAPRCLGDVPWDGRFQVPDGATTFSLSAGQNLTDIDVALSPGGGIEGTVFELGGATPVNGVIVDIFNPAGDLVTLDYTFTAGSYRFDSLVPGDYVVCFDGRYTGGPDSFAPQCYDNVAWSGD
jgi:hypothetical protein